MLGKYTIKGMRFHAFHGSNDVERELGIGYVVNVTVIYPLTERDDSTTAQSKVVGADIYEITKDVIMNTKYASRSSLGIEISKRLFVQFKEASEIGIEIVRTTIFIPGSIDQINTEIWCKRSDFGLDL